MIFALWGTVPPLTSELLLAIYSVFNMKEYLKYADRLLGKPWIETTGLDDMMRVLMSYDALRN